MVAAFLTSLAVVLATIAAVEVSYRMWRIMLGYDRAELPQDAEILTDSGYVIALDVPDPVDAG